MATCTINTTVAFVGDETRYVAVSLTNLSTSSPIVLEATAATIWHVLRANADVDAIAEEVARIFLVADARAITADVRQCLLDLETHGLVTLASR